MSAPTAIGLPRYTPFTLPSVCTASKLYIFRALEYQGDSIYATPYTFLESCRLSAKHVTWRREPNGSGRPGNALEGVGGVGGALPREGKRARWKIFIKHGEHLSTTCRRRDWRPRAQRGHRFAGPPWIVDSGAGGVALVVLVVLMACGCGCGDVDAQEVP